MGLDVVQNLTPFGTSAWFNSVGVYTAVTRQARGRAPDCRSESGWYLPLLLWKGLGYLHTAIPLRQLGSWWNVRINPLVCVSPAVFLVTVWWNRCSGDGFQITNSRTGGFFCPQDLLVGNCLPSERVEANLLVGAYANTGIWLYSQYPFVLQIYVTVCCINPPASESFSPFTSFSV